MENLLLLSIGINTDVFETNIINIGILVALLFNVVGASLKSAMLERKESIVTSVQAAEQSVSEAKERLEEAQTQLSQSKLVIDKICSDKALTIKSIVQNNQERAIEEIERQANSTKLAIVYKEQQVLREVKEQISTLALSRVITTLKESLTIDNHVKLLDNSIEKVFSAF
jgi:F-type H+-transporting ATPase subunit b